MIEKMKKLSLLIYHGSKDHILNGLQNLGVIHLEANKSVTNENIIKVKDEISTIHKLDKFLTVVKDETKGKKSIEESSSKREFVKKDFTKFLENIEKEKEHYDTLVSERDNLKREREILDIWGEFDPEVLEEIKSSGLQYKFYSMPSSQFGKLDISAYPIEKVAVVKGVTYFVSFFSDPKDLEGLSATEERPPLKRASALDKTIHDLNIKIEHSVNNIMEYIPYQDELKAEIVKLNGLLDFDIVNASLESELDGKLLFINGWVPNKTLKSVEEFLEKGDLIYLLEEPTSEDNVPVKLKNGKVVTLFEPIGKFHSLPIYTELEPTPFFAPFFALFFGLCIGDLGYGLVLFTVCVLGMLFVKSKGLKPFLLLGLILSFVSICTGTMLNSFFGEPIVAEGATIPFPDFIKNLVFFNLNGDMYASMTFAIIIGVLQVMFGFILQVINKIKAGGIQAGFQPLGTFCILAGLFITISKMLAGVEIPLVQFFGKLLYSVPSSDITLFGMEGLRFTGVVILGVGVLLVLLFNNIDKPIFVRPFLGLWEMYSIVTGIPGDILSYIRLFALGLAGGLLGNAFNQIAFMLRDGIGGVGGIIGMVLIMIFGHSLNLALTSLGAFVHPLRLTLLEFYKSIGFTGGGKAYAPFKK